MWLHQEELLEEGILLSRHMMMDHLPDVSYEVLRATAQRLQEREDRAAALRGAAASEAPLPAVMTSDTAERPGSSSTSSSTSTSFVGKAMSSSTYQAPYDGGTMSVVEEAMERQGSSPRQRQ